MKHILNLIVVIVMTNKDYSKKPSCEGCHDDMSYPQNKPGKLVK